MYAARGRQKSVRGKFQLGKLCIGQQFQLFDNTLRQLPQSSFIGHQVALHEPQLVDKPQPGAGVVEHGDNAQSSQCRHGLHCLHGLDLVYAEKGPLAAADPRSRRM
mgnify:CR=1 FL=1